MLPCTHATNMPSQESTEFADADILADWEVPDITKPQRRARA